MMRLRDATLCATVSNKVAHEDGQGKDAAEKEVQDLKRELGGKTCKMEAEVCRPASGTGSPRSGLGLPPALLLFCSCHSFCSFTFRFTLSFFLHSLSQWGRST